MTSAYTSTTWTLELNQDTASWPHTISPGLFI